MRGKRVGVLALQGAFAEHLAVLERLKVAGREVRLPQELDGLDALIIPGGESTSIGKLIELLGLRKPIVELAQQGFPLFGTCAGMVLVANKVSDSTVAPLGLMDIEVRRNALGRQVDSFQTELPIPALGQAPFPAVFIRAPVIERVGAGVEVLTSLPQNTPVAVRQGNVVAAAFHPELSKDLRFHAYFLNLLR